MIMASPTSPPAPLPSVDRRRRISRDLADHLVERARWLLPEDRALIHLVFRDNVPAIEIARARAESMRTIRRRIRRLTDRLVSREFETVLRKRSHWPPTLRKVATACILQGRTQRQAAEHLQLSVHVVRASMLQLRTLIEEADL